jgi:murein DD-endopeptidase MepM/ murein hydrolase activator NlpD
MAEQTDPSRALALRRPVVLSAAVLASALCAALLWGGRAPAQDLHEQLESKQEKLAEVREREGVLTTTIASYGDRISRLEGEVAGLREQEAAAEANLAATEAELDRAVSDLRAARDRLAILREHLKRALVVLRERLVAIYQSGTTDTLSVILSADGYEELVGRSEYLQQIQEGDEAIVDRVRDLRDQAKRTVRRLREAKRRIEAARDAIAAEERRLASARAAVEARQFELVAARGDRATALAGIRSHERELHGDVSDLQAQIEAQLQATQSATPLPAGPVQYGSSGLIWPVDGPVVSGFGWRWGRMHEGVDIAVPAGTPIRAAASGAVVIAGWVGGYGNYTCVDHGGGLSTCYAHQSSFAASSGAEVAQGQVIGYVGCTGHCYGDHLHFEVRVNGAAQDPMGYL